MQPEPTTGYVFHIGQIGIIGTVLGMPLEAMILGAVAGAVMLGRHRRQSRINGLTAIAVSTLLAGAFSPVIGGWLVEHLSVGEQHSRAEMLRPLVPVLIGGGWSWLAPILDEQLRTIIGSIAERIRSLIKGAP